MRYYKVTADNGDIMQIGQGSMGVEITEDEYSAIQSAFATMPKIEAGKARVLTADLTWRLEETDIVNETDEISGDELLAMMEGVL